MTGLEHYAQELAALIASPGRIEAESAAAHLDGRPAREVRAALKRELRRERGIFMTPAALADQAIAAIPGRLGDSTITDPASGCGDLLLSAMRAAAANDEADSIKFEGTDRERELVAIAQARLNLFARSDGWTQFGGQAAVDIQVGDGNRVPGRFDSDCVVVLNPPFGQSIAPATCTWSSGLTSSAALFLDGVLDRMDDGCRLSAILPDVIRSGSRYGKLRQLVAKRLRIESVKPLGLFDPHADIDVFLLTGTAKTTPDLQEGDWIEKSASDTTLADHFDVSVGPVVDNRDPERGPWRPFITSRSVSGEVGLEPTLRRRFRGRAISPPFAVTGRTSRPTEGSGSRLQVSVVTGSQPVAVENHLLVMKPHSGTLEDCLRAKTHLESPEVSQYLDHRIRLRHLTVQALKEVSWRAETNDAAS
jgi:hypothetical protein